MLKSKPEVGETTEFVISRSYVKVSALLVFLPTSALICGDTSNGSFVNFTSSRSNVYFIDKLESLLKGKPILGTKYNLSVFKGFELGVEVV